MPQGFRLMRTVGAVCDRALLLESTKYGVIGTLKKISKCVGAADSPPCITATKRKRDSAQPQERRGGCVSNKISRSHRKRRRRARSASAIARSRNSGFPLCSQSENHPGLAVSGGFAIFF